MKHSLLATLIALLLVACHQNPRPAFKPNPARQPVFFVSGTYTAFEKSGYCRTWDTVTITRDKRQINVYRINRMTAYQRNLDDYYYPVERETATWKGSYDPAQTFMQGLDGEPDLLLDPPNNRLIVSGHLFIKIE